MAVLASAVAAPSRDDRPIEGRKDRTRGVFGKIMSAFMHAVIILLLIPPESIREELAQMGGTGWADEINIKSALKSSSGFEGKEGTDEQVASAPQAGPVETMVEVQLLSEDDIVPKPPELAIPLAEEEVLMTMEAPDAVRPSPHPAPSPPPSPETAGAQTADQTLATAPRTDSQVSAGGSGMQDSAAGSPNGANVGGLGQGNADQLGRGDVLKGNELLEAFNGFTIIGQEGQWDGSTPDNAKTRYDHDWQVYYAPDGSVEARFQRVGAKVPHGAMQVLSLQGAGTWRIEGDFLCQQIEKYGFGAPVCFIVAKDGDEIAMYYASCGALYRCYKGRRGPTGKLVPGRAFTR